MKNVVFTIGFETCADIEIAPKIMSDEQFLEIKAVASDGILSAKDISFNVDDLPRFEMPAFVDGIFLIYY